MTLVCRSGFIRSSDNEKQHGTQLKPKGIYSNPGISTTGDSSNHRAAHTHTPENSPPSEGLWCNTFPWPPQSRAELLRGRTRCSIYHVPLFRYQPTTQHLMTGYMLFPSRWSSLVSRWLGPTQTCTWWAERCPSVCRLTHTHTHWGTIFTDHFAYRRNRHALSRPPRLIWS